MDVGKPIDVGKIIKDACCRKGITQSELARRIKRPRQLVNDWIHNRKCPDMYSLVLLDRELDIVRELFNKNQPNQESTDVQIMREIADIKSTINVLTCRLTT